MLNDILGCLTIAGTFFTAGFIGAVWDFKRAQRKKARLAKQEELMEQYNEDINEAIALGEKRVFDHLAEARKHSYSDNNWNTLDVL